MSVSEEKRRWIEEEEEEREENVRSLRANDVFSLFSIPRDTWPTRLLFFLISSCFTPQKKLSYFDPSSNSCRDSPNCNGRPGLEGHWDCGPCASFTMDSELGHCETIVGCGGAKSVSWPQVINGEKQSDVSDRNTIV